MIKEKLCEIIESAYLSLCGRGKLSLPCPAFQIVRQNRPERGDFSCSLALKLGARASNSFALAEDLAATISQETARDMAICFAAPPGYLNFRPGDTLLALAVSAMFLDHSARRCAPCDTEASYALRLIESRCASILRRAREPRPDIVSGTVVEAWLDQTTFDLWLADFEQSKTFEPLFSLDEFCLARTLIINLDVVSSDLNGDLSCEAGPAMIEALMVSTSAFLDQCLPLQLDLSVVKARLGLIFACRQVVCRALGIIGLSAPERM